MQPYPAPVRNRMEPHVKAVAVINLVFAALGLLVALFMLFAFGVASAVTGATAEVGWLPGFLAAFGVFFVVLVAGLAILYLMAGIKLNQRKRAGKTLGLVTAALSLLSFPFGTLFGAYALWALLQRDTDALLAP